MILVMVCLGVYSAVFSIGKSKSSHQDQGLCYLQLPILFLYIQSPLLLENKKLLSSLFSSVN